jgi:hypothetical protein
MRNSVFPEENGENDAGTQPEKANEQNGHGGSEARSPCSGTSSGTSVAGASSHVRTYQQGVFQEYRRQYLARLRVLCHPSSKQRTHDHFNYFAPSFSWRLRKTKACGG